MKTKNKSNLLLIELILAVLFFSLAASICVKVMFSSYEISMENSILTKATITGDSLVTVFKEKDINRVCDIIKELYPSSDIMEKKFTIHLDNDFKDVSSENAKYNIEITVEDHEYTRNLVIRVLNLKKNKTNPKIIYSLSTANFIEGGFENEKK